MKWSSPRRYQTSLLFLCNIIDLSLLHVTECGRLMNLITSLDDSQKFRAVNYPNFGVLLQEK